MNKTIDKELFLKELGCELWHLRDKKIQPDSIEIVHSNEELKSELKMQDEPIKKTNWEELNLKIQSCTSCILSQSRKQAVVGSGNQNADLMIIGEAPGANEDELGLPFVGRSGGLLDSIFFAIGLKREDIYIANIIKCRPPSNRNPEVEEMNECHHFLYQQIDLVKPKLIVTLGAISSQYLLKTTEPMGQLRQKIHTLEIKNSNQTYPLIASYHPAYLLRDPMQKAKAWQDWKTIKEQIN